MTENDIVFERCQFCFSKMSLTTYLWSHDLPKTACSRTGPTLKTLLKKRVQMENGRNNNWAEFAYQWIKGRAHGLVCQLVCFRFLTGGQIHLSKRTHVYIQWRLKTAAGLPGSPDCLDKHLQSDWGKLCLIAKTIYHHRRTCLYTENVVDNSSCRPLDFASFHFTRRS